MNIGDNVTWKHQAKGKHKEKTGKVVAIIEPGEHGNNKLPAYIPHSCLEFDSSPKPYRRLLVEVDRGGKSKLSDFYAPNAATVKVVAAV